MMHMRIRRPAPATAIACLALFVALGGSSYAALRVDSAEIVDNTVRSGDIRNNSVSSRDVRDGSLRAGDFASDQLPAGPQGPRGSQGLPGATGPKGDPATTLWAVVESNGKLIRGSGVTNVARTSLGSYKVTFNRSVNACVYTPAMTEATHSGGYNMASHLDAVPTLEANTVGVYIWNTMLNSNQDRTFSLLITC